MKAILALAALIVTASFSFDCQTSQQDQDTDVENQRIVAGLKTMHEMYLHKRLQAELDADRIERETEQILWNTPEELMQHRALIARRIAYDVTEEQQFQQEGDPPDPRITFERAALTRIDARLQELADIDRAAIALRENF